MTSSRKRGFLIDMDGVIYRESEMISGAIEWIEYLIDTSTPFLFLTNNSQRNRRDIVTKLHRMGMQGVEEKHIFTCAMSTARYLEKVKPRGTAYVIGESGLVTALHKHDFSIVDSDPDFVVIGECRTLNLEMLERAVQLVMNGAKLIATNLDPSCPVSNGGIRPGCGAYVAMIEAATGVKAFSVGKPSPIMMIEAKNILKLQSKNTFMIGDTMDTDILGGIQGGFNTILVLSGGTNKEDLSKYAYQPDIILDSVADLLPDKVLQLIEA